MIDMGNEKLYISLAKMAYFQSLDEGLGLLKNKSTADFIVFRKIVANFIYHDPHSSDVVLNYLVVV